jgi:hypothetical protein
LVVSSHIYIRIPIGENTASIVCGESRAISPITIEVEVHNTGPDDFDPEPEYDLEEIED